MGTDYQCFVGVDWGGESHQVCVLDQHWKKLGERSFHHSGQGLAELTIWLSEIVAGKPARMAAAIEVPHGALVETFTSAWFCRLLD